MKTALELIARQLLADIECMAALDARFLVLATSKEAQALKAALDPELETPLVSTGQGDYTQDLYGSEL
jgi:hypothetical protein